MDTNSSTNEAPGAEYAEKDQQNGNNDEVAKQMKISLQNAQREAVTNLGKSLKRALH